MSDSCAGNGGAPGSQPSVVPGETWDAENDLSLYNMDFSEFADNADPDSIVCGAR
jgi:hypothetical protein